MPSPNSDESQSSAPPLLAEAVLSEAQAALDDPQRVLAPAALAAATMAPIAGAAAAGAAGAVLVGMGGAVFFSPIIAFGPLGWLVWRFLSSKVKRQREEEARQWLFQEALRKRDALLRRLQEENHSNTQRIRYLSELVDQLQRTIEGLDQASAAA